MIDNTRDVVRELRDVALGAFPFNAELAKDSYYWVAADEIERLRTSLDAAIMERDQWKRTAGAEAEMNEEHRKGWEEAEAERDALRAALLKYGDHLRDCGDDCEGPCFCGFDAARSSALAGASHQPDEGRTT